LTDYFIGLASKTIEEYEKKVLIAWITLMVGYAKDYFLSNANI
jgi:hypothetical protein